MRFFWGDDQASAGIYFALGASALITASTMTFDLVRFIQVQVQTERVVVTIADYASRENEVDCGEVRALARFVHTEVLGEHSYGLLVLTSATGDATATTGFTEDWTWTPPFALGPADDSARLNQCSADLAPNRTETLTTLAMSDGEGVVMAQLCLAPNPDHFIVPSWAQEAVGMEIYRYYVLPIRASTLTQTCT